MGIWNERGADTAWTVQLRSAMDAAGYMNTRIVSADTSWDPVTTDISTNPAYAAAVDIIGAHYPGQPPALAYTLNKTLFASEMWNLVSASQSPPSPEFSLLSRALHVLQPECSSNLFLPLSCVTFTCTPCLTTPLPPSPHAHTTPGLCRREDGVPRPCICARDDPGKGQGGIPRINQAPEDGG